MPQHDYPEPQWPLFLKVNPSKQGLFQAKQGSFGFQVILNSRIFLVQWKKNLTKTPKVLYPWSERQREYPKPYIAIVIAISATPDDSSRTFGEAAYCCAYVVGASRHRAQRSCGTAGGQPGLNGIGPQGALPHGCWLLVAHLYQPRQIGCLFVSQVLFGDGKLWPPKSWKMVVYDWGSILQ